MKERVEKLIEVAKELNKLADELIEFAWKIGSLAGILLYILYTITH